MNYDDDDIFKKNDDDILQTSSFSSSERVRGLNVPGYLRDALERYIKDNPGFGNSFKQFQNNEFKNIYKVIDLFSSVQKMLIKFAPDTSYGPLARALTHVLDSAYEGAIQRTYKAIVIESDLIALHMNLNFLSSTQEAIINSGQELHEAGEIFYQFLLTSIELTIFCIKQKAIDYVSACETSNLKPDTNIIEYGFRKEADFPFDVGTKAYTIGYHYIYGDVRDVSVNYEASIRNNFIKYFVPMLYKDEAKAYESISANIA